MTIKRERNALIVRRELNIRPDHYRLIHKLFDYRTNHGGWEDEDPLTLDDKLPDNMAQSHKDIYEYLKRTYPWLRSYCLYNLLYKSNNVHYLLGHPSYRCKHKEGKNVYEVRFKSEFVKEQPSDKQTSDKDILENNKFRFPLMRKCSASEELQKHDRVTIVLHGLNEGGFLKYLPWAYGIMLGIDAPVAIFPFTFTINRAARQWGNDRGTNYLPSRRGIPGNGNISEFNAIISERLDAHPERFFWGAIQSYWDLVDLVRQIRQPEQHLAPDGSLPFIAQQIAPNARIDFLGFSSGGYLALALLAVNHEGLFSNSRACLFATCAEMRSLGAGSPFTLDRVVQNTVRKFYVDYMATQPNDRIRHWISDPDHQEGVWLGSFGGLAPDRTQRLERLREIAPQLLAIANSNDRVMPPGAMLDALQGKERDTGVMVKNLDLGIHEHPFCLSDYSLSRDNKRRFLRPYDERYSIELEQFIDSVVEHFG